MKPKRLFSTLILALLALPGCSAGQSPSAGPTPFATAESVEAQTEKAREAAAKASFNPADLSGCWRHARLRPVYEPSSGGLMLRKTGENRYAVEDTRQGVLTVTGTRISYETKDSEPQAGETRFTTWPYQIAFEEVVGLGGLEHNTYGWEWAGKKCS